MAFTSIPTSGAKLRASVLSDLVTEVRPVAAVKSADTSRVSTTTHTADPDLTLTLDVGTWEVRALLVVTSAANGAGDFSFRWAFPTGSLSSGQSGSDTTLSSGTAAAVVNVPGTTADTSSPSGAYDFGASTSPTAILAQATVTVLSTGSVAIEWAQVSSNASATILKAGSALVARRLS